MIEKSKDGSLKNSLQKQNTQDIQDTYNVDQIYVRVLNVFSDEYEFKHGAVFKESTKSNLICIHPFDSPYYKSALSGSGEEYTEYIKK